MNNDEILTRNILTTRGDGLAFLAHYGWITAGSDGASTTDAIRKFQRVSGLLVDGEIGPKTLLLMNEPRCGCKDYEMSSTIAAAVGDGEYRWADRDWEKDPLTYRFKRYVNGISENKQRELAALAVSHWNATAAIQGREAKVGERADVHIDVGRGRRDNFDGPGRTLAWAILGGNLMMFDLDENWGVDRGIRWMNVFSHEWGHILCLHHSTHPTALLAAIYSAAVDRPQSPDDAERLSGVYGGPPVNPGDGDGGNGGGTVPVGFTGSLITKYTNGTITGFDVVATSKRVTGIVAG